MATSPRHLGAAGLAFCLAALSCAAGASGGDYRPLPGGQLRSVLPADGVASDATVAPF